MSVSSMVTKQPTIGLYTTVKIPEGSLIIRELTENGLSNTATKLTVDETELLVTHISIQLLPSSSDDGLYSITLSGVDVNVLSGSGIGFATYKEVKKKVVATKKVKNTSNGGATSNAQDAQMLKEIIDNTKTTNENSNNNNNNNNNNGDSGDSSGSNGTGGGSGGGGGGSF